MGASERAHPSLEDHICWHLNRGRISKVCDFCPKTGADKRRLRHVSPATPEGCSKGGRMAAHLRWHRHRQVFNPYCEFCLEG
jgi:hypothetical protein